MEKEENVEELDLEETQKVEKIEKSDSIYSNLRPITEMAEMTKEDRKEIQEKLANEETKEEIVEELKPKKKMSIGTKITLIIVIILVLTIGYFWVMWPNIKSSITQTWKPIIYIYPTEDTNVSIKVSNPELFTVTYPKYEDGWKVRALTDGKLIDKNGNMYNMCN